MDEIQHTEFENINFDAKELVQRYRKRVPLPHLQKSLRAHHAATRQELVELINEKYADFVNLSSRMQGVERALKPLRAPLEESSELTKGLHGKLNELLRKAEEAHEGLGRVRSRKEALHLYIENAKLLQKLRARGARSQESVARDLRRIHLSLANSDASECQALLNEAIEFQDDFRRQLEEKLKLILVASKRSWEAGNSVPRSELVTVSLVCRALCTIGQSEAVESIFCEVFTKARLQELSATCNAAAEEKRKTTDAGSMVGGAVDLALFFQSVQKAFFEDSPLLWFAHRFRGGEGDEVLEVPLKLVANAVVAPSLRQVQEVWPNVFMPAFPDTFAANYRHCTKFLEAAEEVSREEEFKREAFGDFQRKWKTQVYCSLRTKEASQRMDAAARAPAQTQSGGKYWLEVSAELLRTTELVWNAWYLDCLYPKMARLSLELVARYGKIMSAFAESSAAGGWDSAASPGSSPTVLLCRAAADVLQVIASLTESNTGSIAKLFNDRLPFSKDERPREIAHALLEDAAQSLQPPLALLKDGMVKHVVAAMATPFAAIRGLPAFYRMLNKPVPTNASPYVESSLRPLTAFREVVVSCAIEGTSASWLQEMVDGAAEEFTSQATQLIQMTHQQEASLRRLAGRESNSDQVSDLDKIYIQLCIDVDTFISMATAIAGTASCLEKLKEAVAGIRRA